MSEEAARRQDDLTDVELSSQAGEELPDCEVLSLVDANVAIPINAAVAASLLSDDAVACANAEQDAASDQAS